MTYLPTPDEFDRMPWPAKHRAIIGTHDAIEALRGQVQQIRASNVVIAEMPPIILTPEETEAGRRRLAAASHEIADWELRHPGWTRRNWPRQAQRRAS